MKTEEYERMKERLSDYRRAEQRSRKLDKAKVMLDAIVDGDEHEIETIVIDVRKKRVRYTSVRGGSVSSICVFERDDEGEMVTDFLGWAVEQVQSRINAADAEMAEA
jgi:hypothetical protein